MTPLIGFDVNLGERAMSDQPRPSYPFLGLAAGTPLLTPDGVKRIEDIKPGDVIQTQPNDQSDGEPHAHDGQGDDEPRWWERN